MSMARAHAAKLTDDRAACEIKIAKRVEQLVANEFVIIPQAAGVQDVIAADDDDVVERPATAEARGPKSVDLVEKAKRAGSTDLRLERPCLEHHAGILPVDQRIVEINLEAHRKAVIRQQCCETRSRCPAGPVAKSSLLSGPNGDRPPGTRLASSASVVTLSSYPPTCDRLLENCPQPNLTLTAPPLRLKSLFVSNCCAGQYSPVLPSAENRWQCRRSGTPHRLLIRLTPQKGRNVEQ